MKTMWILTKDHLRRNWIMTSLYAIMLANFVSLIVPGTLSAPSGERSLSHWPLYYFAFIFINSIAFTRVNRAWRMLPIGEAALATLQWRAGVWGAPALSFLIVAPLHLFSFASGRIDMYALAWPFLFLLNLTLMGGTMAFVQSLPGLSQKRTAAVQIPQQPAHYRMAYTIRLVFEYACGLGTLFLMLLPTPSNWSDLKAGNVAGMYLAAWLTWRSYSMRHALLVPIFAQDARIHKPPKPADAPRKTSFVLTALARDIKTSIQRTLLVVLAWLAVSFCLIVAGPFMHHNDYNTYVHVIALAATMPAAMSVFTLTGLRSRVRMYRSLPLTAAQDTLLTLSYSVAAALAVLPLVTPFLWFIGYGSFPALLLLGVLLIAGLCPFGMFILIGQGERSFTGIAAITCFCLAIGGGMLSAAGVYIPLSATFFCTIGALMAFFGHKGYHGLRRLIENDSDIYKPEPAPQWFNQQAER